MRLTPTCQPSGPNTRPKISNANLKPLAKFATFSVALLMAGCAGQQQRMAHRSGGVDHKYGVAASPRVVADGQPVPKGGGNYMVGKPYVIAGKTYYPSDRFSSATGMASWYGADFHGRRTANGEIFDKASVTAAHPTMPLPSYARVTNLSNHHSIIVRVNDRGPYHGGRVMDVSERVADALDFKRNGTARVKVDYVAPASLKGSDYNMLLATLRLDGTPANIGGPALQPTMIADSAPPAPRRAPVVLAAASMPALQGTPMAETMPEAMLSANAAPPILSNAPLPPSRPFDLGTIPGADVPIAAPPTQKQARLVSYYVSTPISLSDRFEKRGPFEGLKPQRLQKLQSLPD